MKVQTIFRMPSPYRDDFRIKAYTFGSGRKALCIVGSMRGDELQQLYIASRLVSLLRQAEAEGRISDGVSISVIPSANPFSMNIEKRFWALDNTDINRMFPGYDQGETTQRIAAGLFEFIKDFEYGIQLASYYLPGRFLPHVRMLHTGFEDIDDARHFGFPYVAIHKPEPFDTVLLNYNWQIWETHAYSLYAGTTDVIDPPTAQDSIDAIGRFMNHLGLTTLPVSEAEIIQPEVLSDDRFLSLLSPHAGILLVNVEPGQKVSKGDVIARIMHPYEGTLVASITSPVDATVFFARNKGITFQNTLLFRLIIG